MKDAVDKFSRPIYMVSLTLVCHRSQIQSQQHAQVIGGLHLAGTELVERIPPTVDFLANKLRPSPTYVLPMHCTGFAAKIALEDALGEACVPAGVGHKVTIPGTPETEQMMHAPTYS